MLSGRVLSFHRERLPHARTTYHLVPRDLASLITHGPILTTNTRTSCIRSGLKTRDGKELTLVARRIITSPARLLCGIPFVPASSHTTCSTSFTVMAAAAAAPLAGKPKQLSAALREVCQVEFDKC